MKITQLMLSQIKNALDAYNNHLSGIFCIYKPTGYNTLQAIRTLKRNVLKELNKLPAYDYEIKQMEREKAKKYQLEGPSGVPMVTNVPEPIVDYSKHKLVLGDMFLYNHLEVYNADEIDENGSGVVVCSIGEDAALNMKMIKMAKYLRVYHVKGRLGYSTDTCYTDGKFVKRTTYAHINKGKMDKVCSAAQYAHQKLMFECAGVNPNTQEAYELASKGLVRPSYTNRIPVLYGIKCIEFNPPDFTLEVHGIDENCDYLAEMIHNIGFELKSTAVCTHIHRLRYGIFDLSHTLLKKEWTVEDIAKNIKICNELLTQDSLLTGTQILSREASQKEQVDLLTESLLKGQPSKEDIVKIEALKAVKNLRNQIIAEREKQGVENKDLLKELLKKRGNIAVNNENV